MMEKSLEQKIEVLKKEVDLTKRLLMRINAQAQEILELKQAITSRDFVIKNLRVKNDL